MKHLTRTLALPTALAAALVLSACGTADTATTSAANPKASAANSAPASKTKNEADVVFASMMIPHHAQAISMADTALKQATDPKVKALTTKIKAAQGPEIERMSGWLTGWGAPVPAADAGSDMAGMEGMGDQTGGMMSAKEITNLNKATGSAFDRTWLQMMIKHHQGAVAMAKTALDQGSNPEAKKLAQSIIDGQSAEISEMNSILPGIPA
ncbi:MAG TPA: DUF305 domain-containing protein [Dermatophilaceae bacterium]